MKPFSFRLNSILSYRKHREKKAQIALSQAKKQLIEKEKMVERLITTRIEVEKRCSLEAANAIEVPVYKIYMNFLNGLDRDLEKATRDLNESKKEVSFQQNFLSKESIRKKMIETLRDIQFRNYIDISNKEEQKVLDEMALIRRDRRS